MNNVSFSRPDSVDSALHVIGSDAAAKFLGGGTNLVDLMRENIEHPDALIDVTRLPLAGIDELPNGGLRIGATVRNSHMASHPLVRERYPVLSQAVLMGASAQLRNMATTAGNLMQRTRCLYFYDSAARCNKREPGTGCDAIGGFNRINAILGTSPHCIATHPSDMCVAMAALDAVVQVKGPNGERSIAFGDFHRQPGDTPERDTNLEHGEMITAVDLPAFPAAKRSVYRKVRDRASYAFALVSVAAVLDLDGDTVRDVRIALGGVGTVPWRASTAEAALKGKPLNKNTLRTAAQAELAPAQLFENNAFKKELAERVIVNELMNLAKGEQQ